MDFTHAGNGLVITDLLICDVPTMSPHSFGVAAITTN